MGKQMCFLQEACRVLGISLALYTMSPHVVTLIWVILQQVHMQHQGSVRVPESSMSSGSIAGSI